MRHLYTWSGILVVVFFSVVGDILIARAMTQVGANIQAPVQETLTPYSAQWNLNVQRSLPASKRSGSDRLRLNVIA